MDSKNQKRDKLGTHFVSELDCAPISDHQITEAPTLGFDVGTYAISSTAFLGAQGRRILPIRLEMEKESDMRRKQFKVMAPAQQCVYLSVPENSSPLGLTLRKTPSFLDLVETQLSLSNTSFSMPRKRKSTDADDDAQQSYGKTKASNFSCSLLRIGSWERISRYDGELVAKFYFAKRKLVWEVLDSGLKNKIEVLWSDIASIKAVCNDNSPQTLEIELLRQPLFFRETNPQPRKHTLWKTTADFTDGQASIFRRHFLQFPQGTLQKHYEKLLQLDNGLSLLSKKPYPSLDSPFFGPDNVESQNPNDHFLGLEGHEVLVKQMLDSGTSDENSDQFHHCFSLSRTTVPQQCKNLDLTSAYEEISSPSSGTSGAYLGHETSSSPVNTFLSGFVSLPPQMSESYCHFEKKTDELKTQLLGNTVGVRGLHQGKFNEKQNTSSTFDIESSCWISEVEIDRDLVGSSEGIVHRSDKEFNGFSCLGEVSGNLREEIYDNCDEFLAYISGANVRDFLEGTSWT